MFASVRSLIAELSADFDASGLDAAGAAEAVRELGLIRRLLDGMLAKAANRVHDTAAHLETGERDAASFVAHAVGVDVGEARRAIETASRLADLPVTDAAVRDGRLSASQAALIAHTASQYPQAERRLLAAAKLGNRALRDACQRVQADNEDPTARSRRQHAARELKMWTANDGMVEGTFRLAPEIGGQIKQIVDDGAQRIFRGRRSGEEHEPHAAYAADVLTEVFLGDGTAKGTKTTVHVVIDHAALVRGHTVDGERCEIPGVGPVNVQYARDLLGGAFLTAVIEKGRDITTVAHLGRHVPAEVRTAMLVAGRECDIEGCECRGYLELDHSSIDFAAGGPTAYWNLAWLCYAHHRMKSSGSTLGPPNPITGKRPLRPLG